MVSALDRFLGLFGSSFSPEHLARFLLLGKTSLRRLRKTPGGIKFGDISWGDFSKSRLRTPDKKIHLAPADLVDALNEALASPLLPTRELPLLLISGGRRSGSYNTWTHNIPALMDKLRGNWATMNPSDATAAGIRDSDLVRVISRSGSVEIEGRVSPDVREGVVMIHQFWGHKYASGMRTSRTYPGVNVNVLHADDVRDRFTGMPVYNGTPCRVERAVSK